MDTPNTTATGDVSQVAGTEATQSTSDKADPIKNLKGEFQRKLSKLDDKLNQILNTVGGRSQQVSEPVDETADTDTTVKQYVSSALTKDKQMTAWNETLDMFPELNPDSEQFDEKFYKAVDMEFTSNQLKDPRGPLKAAKLVALELGKIEQLTRQSLMKDEARRSRIISEGATSPREAKKEKDPSSNFNAKGLAKLGIDPKKLAERMKNNKDKYEGL